MATTGNVISETRLFTFILVSSRKNGIRGCRKRMQAKCSPQVLLVNATAGAAAGGLASAATTPFDVIKTHTQTNQKEGAKPQGVVEGLLCILRKRGATALFAGWAPRAIRTAVAYSILMGAYEQCKHICASGSGILPRLPAMHVPSPTDASKTS